MSESPAHFQDVRYGVADGIATIVLDRPAKLNAVTIAAIGEITQAFAMADADDDVRAVILTGEGRAFCAGADLSGGFGLPTDGDPATGAGVFPDPGGQATLRIFAMRKPVISAVNGPAVGFGATVLLPTDRRVASSTARFAFPFSRRGIVPDGCSSWFLPRLVGLPKALDWMMSGRTFPVEEALAAGLVEEIVLPEDVLPRARAIARDIVDGTAPVSVAISRRLLWSMAGASHPADAHALESRGLVATLRRDGSEGAAAFMERRPAAFRSRVSIDMDYTEAWWPSPSLPGNRHGQ
jgi:enoyl-CoA hydratase/carnithine racemase